MIVVEIDLSFFIAICLMVISLYGWYKADRLGVSDMKWRKSLELSGCVSLVVGGVFIIALTLLLKLRDIANRATARAAFFLANAFRRGETAEIGALQVEIIFERS